MVIVRSRLERFGPCNAAGGYFTGHLARWNGSGWSTIGLGNTVNALVVSGNDLYVGGEPWIGFGGSSSIVKWDGQTLLPLGSGLNSSVRAMGLSGTSLYVGGQFTAAGAKGSGYIARAYLLTLPALSVTASGGPPNELSVSWPSADSADFALEQAPSLAARVSWAPNIFTITEDGTNKSVTIPATTSAQFFRLRRPL
jgi:hypothetical protein